jgi:CHAT domain-containing protein
MIQLSFIFIAFIISSSVFCQEDHKKYLSFSYAEIDNLMRSEYQKGRYNIVIPIMQAGRQKAKVDFGTIDSVYALYTNNLAFFYEKCGAYDKALPLYFESKDIKEKLFSPQNTSYATALNNIAYLYQKMGKYNEALPLFIEAKDIRESILGNEHYLYTQSLNNLAILYQTLGEYNKALPLYLQAKDLREKVLGKNHPDYASSVNNLGTLYYKMQKYLNSVGLMLEAKNIREKTLGKKHPDYASSLNNIAGIYRKIKKYKEALPFLIEAKEIKEKMLGKSHPSFASSLSNLAQNYKDMEEFKLALPLMMQAKKIRAQTLGINHPSYTLSLNNLTALHIKMAEVEKSWQTAEEALNSSLGFEIAHNYDKKWFEQIMNAELASNKHIKNLLISLKNVFEILAIENSNKDNKAKQIVVADLASALLTKYINRVTNEKDKLRMLKMNNDWAIKSLNVLNFNQDNIKAFTISDKNKSVLLLQATKSEKAYQIGELPDSLIREDKKVHKKHSEVQAKLLQKRTKEEKDSLRNILINLNFKIDEFKRLLKKEYPKHYQLKYLQNKLKLNDLQNNMDDKTVLIEYAIADTLLHIFKISNKDIFWIKNTLPKKIFFDKVNLYHKALKNYSLLKENKEKAYEKYISIAHWFYQQLIEPVLKEKSGIENLIIVTDGELGHLPFETFLTKPAPQKLTDYKALNYLMNKYNISYNYSASLWKDIKETAKAQNNGQILAIAANYDIKMDSSMTDVRLPTDQWLREKLSPLPSARKEVEALQQKYSGFFAFDSLASEKTVKEKASQYAILHFATHGILDAKRPVLSSLALSEDNDSIESNFLQAHEISKMELNADLVVLSACETGYGKFEQGNGIASLARSFMYAGASSLIVSLWKVNDLSTSKIMGNLYENLANGLPKDEALRLSKQQYMQSAQGIMAHPAFWSPFILMGNSEPVNIKEKGNFLPYLTGGLLLLIFVAAWSWNKKR